MYEVTNVKYNITEGIQITGIAKDTWGNYKIIANKYGEKKEWRMPINNKPIKFGLKNFNKDLSIQENQEQGNVLTMPAHEWHKILINIGYLRDVTIEDIKKTVQNITCSEEFYDWENKFIKLANSAEKQLFKEWEESVGYEYKKLTFFKDDEYYKTYKNNKEEEDGYAYVIMNSPRWLKCYFFLKDRHFGEPFLSMIYNYLLCYDYRDKIIEFDYFDEWKGNTDLPEQLISKYNIPDTKMDYENRGFIGRNDMSVYGSPDSEYILVTGIQASIDDWCGTCAVIKNGCNLTPFELHSFAESVSHIEENTLVQLKKIRF